MVLYKQGPYSLHAHHGKIGEDILLLFEQGMEEMDYPLTLEQFEQEVDEYGEYDPDKRLMLILYHFDIPVGVLCAFNNGYAAVSHHWYVLPVHRTYGNCKAMIKFFDHWAKEVGCKERYLRRPQKGFDVVDVKEL